MLTVKNACQLKRNLWITATLFFSSRIFTSLKVFYHPQRPTAVRSLAMNPGGTTITVKRMVALVVALNPNLVGIA